MRNRVYLAGPISGLSYGSATDWREIAFKALDERGILAYSPLRAKGFLKGSEDLSFEKVDVEHPFTTSRGIMTRDYTDCTRADVLLINFMGVETVSAGTAMEMAWAYHLGIPVAVVCEPDNAHLKHPMIKETVDFQTDDLNQAIDIVEQILFPQAASQ